MKIKRYVHKKYAALMAVTVLLGGILTGTFSGIAVEAAASPDAEQVLSKIINSLPSEGENALTEQEKKWFTKKFLKMEPLYDGINLYGPYTVYLESKSDTDLVMGNGNTRHSGEMATVYGSNHNFTSGANVFGSNEVVFGSSSSAIGYQNTVLGGAGIVMGNQSVAGNAVNGFFGQETNNTSGAIAFGTYAFQMEIV